MRDSFVFYRSFYEAIKDLPRSVQGEIYTAIMEYSLYGNQTEGLKQVARSVFTLIKPQLDANKKKFENGCKGGRPKTKTEAAISSEKTKTKPNNNQHPTQSIPNDNVNENENVNDIKEKNKETTHRFSPPALQDVTAFYTQPAGMNLSPADAIYWGNRFVDFYTSKGWKVGNQPMKDWKAAARRCVREWDDKRKQPNGSSYTHPATAHTGNTAAILEKFNTKTR